MNDYRLSINYYSISLNTNIPGSKFCYIYQLLADMINNHS